MLSVVRCTVGGEKGAPCERPCLRPAGLIDAASAPPNGPRPDWVLFTPEGTMDNHSVNGTAKGTGVFSPLEDIWLPDPNVAGLRVNAEDLLDAGLALC